MCDLGVAMPLCPSSGDEPRPLQLPEQHTYQGTEAWRPPEACCAAPDGRRSPRSTLDKEVPQAAASEQVMTVTDRSDVWALGLVVWEMLTGEVPHAHHLRGDEQGEAEFRAALGTRPPLPADVNGAGEIYRLPLQLHLACTQHEPRQRPSARQVARQLVNENECH